MFRGCQNVSGEALSDELSFTEHSTTGRLPTIPGTPFLDADGFVGSDDDVVNDGDSDDFGGLFQSLGDTDVLIAGRRIAAGMVVNDQDTVGGVADGRAEDFAGMDQAVSKSANGDLMAVDRYVLCVERHNPELFLLAFTSHPAEFVQTELDRGGWAGDPGGRFVLAFEFRNPESNFDTSHQAVYGIIGHAFTDRFDLFRASFGQFLQSELLDDLQGIRVGRRSSSTSGQCNQFRGRAVQ